MKLAILISCMLVLAPLAFSLPINEHDSNSDLRDCMRAYSKIIRDLRENWQSPIAYLKRRGYMPADAEKMFRVDTIQVGVAPQSRELVCEANIDDRNMAAYDEDILARDGGWNANLANAKQQGIFAAVKDKFIGFFNAKKPPIYAYDFDKDMSKAKTLHHNLAFDVDKHFKINKINNNNNKFNNNKFTNDNNNFNNNNYINNKATNYKDINGKTLKGNYAMDVARNFQNGAPNNAKNFNVHNNANVNPNNVFPNGNPNNVYANGNSNNINANVNPNNVNPNNINANVNANVNPNVDANNVNANNANNVNNVKPLPKPDVKDDGYNKPKPATNVDVLVG